MDVDPDVALGGQSGAPVCSAHAHRDRARRERNLSSTCGCDGSGRGREADEERVALRVDLGAIVGRERLAEHAPVFGERDVVPRGSELAQKAGRALDVREEERHRPGRSRVAHPSKYAGLGTGRIDRSLTGDCGDRRVRLTCRLGDVEPPVALGIAEDLDVEDAVPAGDLERLEELLRP